MKPATQVELPVPAERRRSLRRRVNGAEVMAVGGLIAAACSAAAGILAQPRLVGAAGVTMLLANAIALILERTRRS